ncbi:MAG: hypothetical protein WC552_08245, partial [Candidatus Omnitrophota bacterium]
PSVFPGALYFVMMFGQFGLRKAARTAPGLIGCLALKQRIKRCRIVDHNRSYTSIIPRFN